MPKRSYYVNRATGAEYSCIAGGIVWPGTAPGVAIIVAVERSAGEQPTFFTLEEAEESRIDGLIAASLRLTEKYGRSQYPEVLDIWYGDPERVASLVLDANLRLEKDKTTNPGGLYIASPYDFDQPNAFEILVQRIKGCLTPDGSGRKRLVLGGCDKLRAYIQNLPSDAALKGSEREYPAVAALGFVLHSLMVVRPWMVGGCGDGEKGANHARGVGLPGVVRVGLRVCGSGGRWWSKWGAFSNHTRVDGYYMLRPCVKPCSLITG